MLDLYVGVNSNIEHPSITKTRKEIDEVRDGLLEVAELSSENEVTNEEIMDALIELAEMIGD